jgi:hypothetical protein
MYDELLVTTNLRISNVIVKYHLKRKIESEIVRYHLKRYDYLQCRYELKYLCIAPNK